MEIMSEFKVGDEVIIIRKTSGYLGKLKVGDSAKIDCFFFDNAGQKISARMTFDSNSISCYHNLENIKLAKPKWSIYNNGLPWEKLSDKQKGKLLVADNNGIMFRGFSTSGRPKFNLYNEVYTAIKDEPVKPTMAELFLIDWQDCEFSLQKAIDCMIAIGWNKPC
jgi:hypothetical protein